METKHTSGPWFIDQYGHVYGWSEKTADGEGTKQTSVLLVDGRHTNATFQDKVVIAAAPELLEALIALEERVMDLRPNGFSQQLAQARAAIAKATGKP